MDDALYFSEQHLATREMVREFAREDERRVLLVLDPVVPLEGKSPEIRQAAFEKGVALCASLAWHFYENNSQLQFRSAGVETHLAPADEIIFSVLEHLAVAQPLPPDRRQSLMADLAASPELFKIIVTSQPHGSGCHAPPCML